MRRRMLMQMGLNYPSADIVLEVGDNNITSFFVYTKDESQYRIIYTDADGVMHSKMGENGADYHLSTQPYSTILLYHKQPRYICVGTTRTPFYKNVIRVTLNNYDAITSVYGRSNTVLAKIVNYENTNLTSIENNAFYDCKNLALTELPNGITSIGNSAFQNCKNLALTELPNGITSIGNSAFQNCTNLALTELPKNLTSIENNAFYDCKNLALTELPNGVTSIGINTFRGCTNLQLNSLPNGVTSIGNSAFYGCTNLALASLPNGVTSIGALAFSNCTKLALTELPSGVTSIGSNTFRNCRNTEITEIPSKVTTIGDSAFSGTKITDIKILNTTQMITSAASMFNAGTTIRVPNALLAEYQADANWSTYNLIGY